MTTTRQKFASVLGLLSDIDELLLRLVRSIKFLELHKYHRANMWEKEALRRVGYRRLYGVAQGSRW